MIYSLTPNPALDLGGFVDRIVPDEKAYVQNETRFPGGNGINAGRVMHRLGVPAICTGFLGGGIGEELKSLLNEEKVKHQFIPIEGHTRVNVTVSTRETHRQTRLSFPGPKILPKEREKLFSLIHKMKPPGMLLIGGSIPPGITPSHIAELLKIANQKKIMTVLDVPGAILKKAATGSPGLIKPNLTEFQEFIGKPVHTLSGVLKEARILTRKIPLICISSVEGGALLVSKESAYFGTIPPIEVKTTVGAGDSMVGAMSACLWQNRETPIDLGKLLQWGLAAACATLSKPGTLLGESKEIHKYLPHVKVRSVD